MLAAMSTSHADEEQSIARSNTALPDTQRKMLGGQPGVALRDKAFLRLQRNPGWLLSSDVPANQAAEPALCWQA